MKNLTSDILKQFTAFLFDADGVLCLGDQPIPGASDFLKLLCDEGKEIFVVSNNSTKTVDSYAKKFHNLGFSMITTKNLITPAKVTASILSKTGSELPVYLIGSKGLQQELANFGVESFGVGSDPAENYTETDFITKVDVQQPVQAVVVSYDVHISYVKIMKAINYIHQPGVKFIATNEDATYPGPYKDVIVPGAGTNVVAVKVPAGKDPMVVGKPCRPMFDYVCNSFGINAKNMLMFGDRLDTDIKFGRDNGFETVLVGTGVHGLSDVKDYKEKNRFDLVPEYYVPSLKDCCDLCQRRL